MESDDSDFYGEQPERKDASPYVFSSDTRFVGDPETVQGLRDRIERFDVDAWVKQHHQNPGHPRQHARSRGHVSNLHNPYAGVDYAWQLTETVDDFLARLPPKTTDQSADVPWIFICNPFIPRISKPDAESQSIRGSENEAPEEEGSQTKWIVEGGMERLHLMTKFMEGMKATGKAPSTVERTITQERKKAVLDILNLAHAGKVRAGKVGVVLISASAALC